MTAPPLLRGKHQIVDEPEREKCQYQNNQEENKTAQDTILETLPAQDFYAVEQPVRHEVEACGH
jgi:hypothetical protein